MSQLRLISIPALALLAACGSLTAHVRGRVVDDNDRPVPGAKVSLGTYPSTAEEPAKEVLESDANGDFSGTITFVARSGMPVRAVEPDLGRGGVAYFNRRREPVTIVVRPLTRVKGRVTFEKLPRPIREWSLREGHRWRGLQIVRPSISPREGIQSTPNVEYVAGRRLEEGGEFEFLLPAGDYTARALGFHQPLSRDFRVAGDGQEVDLGVLEVQAIPGHEIYGAAAPELRFADARGLPKEFTLASLRGKWILLYFWDHRMRSNNWLPGLIQFYNERKELRDRFEIIGVHNCDDVATVAELDHARFWDAEDRKPEPIPFPVVVDDEGKSFNTYFIARGRSRSVPHWFLVNPDGIVDFCPGAYNPAELLKSKIDLK